MRHSRAAKADTNLQKAGLLIVFVTVFAALYLAQDVFIPLALAILLTFVLTPVAEWLERRRLPRSAAATLVVLVVCALTVSLSFVVGDQIVQFGQDLKKYEGEITSKINKIRGTGTGFFGKAAQTIGEIQRATEDNGEGGGGSNATPGAGASTQSTTAPATNPAQVAGKTVANVGRAMKGEPPHEQPPQLGSTPTAPIFTRSADSSPFGQFIGWFGLVLGPLGTIGLVLVLVLFMLLERQDLRDRFIRLSSGGRYIVTTQALTDATERISRFLRAQLIVNGTYGIAVAIGLWIIGLTFGHGVTFPSFILWGVLCGVLRFIPYVGPWVAAAFPVAVSLAVYEGFGVFTATLTMFVVIELISNNFMEPVLYGSSTGISVVALLIAAMIWTALWGPYGLFLSTPLTVCLVVLGRHVPSLSFLDVLLGDRPALPAGDRFYQRLLARDGKDAGNVIKEYAEQHGTIAAADEVFIRAVRIARHDRHADELTSIEETAVYEIADDIIEQMRSSKYGSALTGAKPAAYGKIEPAIDAPLVIGIPAHHRAETIALTLVATLLEPIGARVEALSCSLLPTDVETRIEGTNPAAVFIAVIPPGGATQARYLCRRLRRKFKELPIVIGYFGTYRDFDALLIRFRASGATYVTTSISQSRSQLASLLELTFPPEIERLQAGPLAPEQAVQAAAATRSATDSLCTPAAATNEVRR